MGRSPTVLAAENLCWSTFETKSTIGQGVKEHCPLPLHSLWKDPCTLGTLDVRRPQDKTKGSEILRRGRLEDQRTFKIEAISSESRIGGPEGQYNNFFLSGQPYENRTKGHLRGLQKGLLNWRKRGQEDIRTKKGEDKRSIIQEEEALVF
jgi:hypothetical protein